MAVPPHRRAWPTVHGAVLLLVAALSVASPASAARTGTVAGRVTGALPATGHGQTTVRAYNVNTGKLTKLAVVPASGKFSLRLPSGGYLLLATAMRDRGVVAERRLAVSVRGGQRRRNVRLAVSRPSAKPVAATLPADGSGEIAAHATGSTLTYQFDDMTGNSRGRAALARALPALLAAGTEGRESCAATQLASPRERRAVSRTSALRRSPLFDAKTRVRRHLANPRVIVRGALSRGRDGSHTAVELRLVDRVSGRTIDTLRGQLRRRGRGLMTDQRRVAAALAERLCQRPRRYRVALALKVRGEYTAYNSTASLVSAVTARSSTAAPYVSWLGAQPFTWTDNVFRSRVLGCPATTVTPGQGSWSAKVSVVSSAAARVDLDLLTAEWTAFSSGIFNCSDFASVTGVPGPMLTGMSPRSFTLPLTGGVGTINSTLTLPTGGFIQQGTVTLTPLWSHTMSGASQRS